MSTVLVSDQEREYTVGLLRGHWLTGRLTAEEFEQRVGEVWRARSAQDLWQALRWLPVEGPPALPRKSNGSAVAALILGVLGMCMLVVSFGLLSPFALPCSLTAWIVGRGARRSPLTGARGAALAGEVLGILGTIWSVLMVAGCAALFVV